MNRLRVQSSRVLLRAAVGVFAAVVISSCAGGDKAATTTGPTSTDSTAGDGSDDRVRLEGVTFEVRRDPGCGCCTSWVEYLQRHGATVELSEDADRAAFRSGLGINDAAASCHTAVVDGYAIEGHVAAGAIQRLLAERPDAVGLALAGMPSDSPGMGGDTASWEQLPVMLVSTDGDLKRFDY